MKRKIKSLWKILLVIVLAFVVSSCEKENSEEELPVSKLASDDYVVYEGIFLDNQEVLNIFADIRGQEAPYDIIPSDFHVTTLFLPDEENTNYSLYGQKVKIHIVGYKCGSVKKDDGSITHNEGLAVELSCDNADMQKLIESIEKSWHITGSSQEAAKYTEYLDFSTCKELDITIEGTYGAYLNSKDVVLNPVER